MRDPHVAKVAALLVTVGVLWATVPYLDKFALLDAPQMSPAYFQFWRGLMVATIVLVCAVVMHRNDLACLRSTLTAKKFGIIFGCAVPVAIYMLCWLHLVRTRVLRVSILYSSGVGIAVLVSCLMAYGFTYSTKAYIRELGERLRPENYVGIALVIIGVVLVGLDLKRLKVK